MSMLAHHVRARLRHWRTAGNRHGVHSPFVYALVEQVLRKHGVEENVSDIEQLRTELMKDGRMIHVRDLGAGSQCAKGPERRIRDIARTALKPRRQAEMLFRLTRYFKPATILELGTSFGITTLYLARAASSAQVHTIEGSPATVAIAQEIFTRIGAKNITLHTGSFDERLPQALNGIDRLDLVFIDGHHAKKPTLDNFEACLHKAHDGTVFIFDDIHWSPGMEEAWVGIRAHPKVTITIDLLHTGLVFLRSGRQREHFRLRY